MNQMPDLSVSKAAFYTSYKGWKLSICCGSGNVYPTFYTSYKGWKPISTYR